MVGFGEVAAAGTTQSSVVSVLRAQHRDHPSPRISPRAWKVSQDPECRVLGCALWGSMWASAQLSHQGRAEAFPGMLKASQGHLVHPGCLSARQEQLEGG